jgi:transposase-like protein
MQYLNNIVEQDHRFIKGEVTFSIFVSQRSVFFATQPESKYFVIAHRLV